MLWLGIGFQREVSQELLEEAIVTTLAKANLFEARVIGLATLEHKSKIGCLIELCQSHHWRLVGFSAEALNQVSVPQPSVQVQHQVGTTSVAEAAALLACQAYTHQPVLLVPKTIFKKSGIAGAVTIAIAAYAEVAASTVDGTA